MYEDSKTQGDVWVNKQRRGKVPEIPDGCIWSEVDGIVPPPRICDMSENINSRGNKKKKGGQQMDHAVTVTVKELLLDCLFLCVCVWTQDIGATNTKKKKYNT